jgi:kynurenine formamidase
MSALRFAPMLLAFAALCAAPAAAMEPWKVLADSRKQTPRPPWPAGDERGMANQIGPATWARCAWHLGQRTTKSYELSHERSSTMPLQGTQMDALGHFAFMAQPWDGKPPFPAENLRYYGGFTQVEVKPTPQSPLARLGMEKAPPIVTSAVLLDARAHLGGGVAMKAGEVVTHEDIEAMLKAQGLGKRGIQPGDVVYVRTGWGDLWRDPDTEKTYYTKAPGLAYDAAQYLGERRVVAVGLDTPFVDPVPEGMHLLTQMGIHHVENAKLDELASDRVWTSCTMILPLRDRGAAGSAVRPVAIGVPGQ